MQTRAPASNLRALQWIARARFIGASPWKWWQSEQRAQDSREQRDVLRTQLERVVRDARRGRLLHRREGQGGREATYGELWGALEERLGRDLGNPHYQLPSLLGYVALEGFERTNLVLTALVIYEGRPDQPGDGFFRLAAGLGIFDEKDAPEIGQEWSQMTPAQEVFWETQVAGLFKFFAGSSGTVTKKATVLDSVDGDGGGRGEV